MTGWPISYSELPWILILTQLFDKTITKRNVCEQQYYYTNICKLTSGETIRMLLDSNARKLLIIYLRCDFLLYLQMNYPKFERREYIKVPNMFRYLPNRKRVWRALGSTFQIVWFCSQKVTVEIYNCRFLPLKIRFRIKNIEWLER